MVQRGWLELWSNLGFRIGMTFIYPELEECANVENKVNSIEQKKIS